MRKDGVNMKDEFGEQKKRPIFGANTPRGAFANVGHLPVYYSTERVHSLLWLHHKRRESQRGGTALGLDTKRMAGGTCVGRETFHMPHPTTHSIAQNASICK